MNEEQWSSTLAVAFVASIVLATTVGAALLVRFIWPASGYETGVATGLFASIASQLALEELLDDE